MRDITRVRAFIYAPFDIALLAQPNTSRMFQAQDLIKDFADEKGRLATVRAVKHHCQYLAQLKAINEGRGLSLVSDTGRCVRVGGWVVELSHTHIQRR